MFRGYCLPKSSIPSCKRFLKNADFLFTDWLCSIASLVSPRNTEIQTTEKFSMVNYCHTQHLGLKSVHIPGVFHPLLNTHDNHPSRYHFLLLQMKKQAQRDFSRITRTVTGWQRGISKSGISGSKVHHTISLIQREKVEGKGMKRLIL